MSKISKRLLSLAIVLAMVLSLTPVISFQAEAESFTDATAIAEQKAKIAQWEATYGALFASTEGVTAPCPFCGEENVTWTGGSGAITLNEENGTHYYLYKEEDNNWTHSAQAVINSSYKQPGACVYLNNQTITMKGRIRIRGGEVNIFGEATFTRENNDKVSDGTKFAPWSMIDVDDRNATVNIWGGTYISQMQLQESGNNPYGSAVIRLTKDTYANKQVNIYGGTFTVDEGAQGTAILAEVGEVNLYGGAISGGTGYVSGTYEYTDATTSETVSHIGTLGGNVYLSNAKFNMHGGTISGGVVTGVMTVNAEGKEVDNAGRGGNIYVGTNATFTMDGGEIYGGQSTSVNGAGFGGNVELAETTSTLNMSGNAAIYGGQARNGGNVMMHSQSKMTMSGNSAVYNGIATTGPNIYLINAKNVLTIGGSATVYGGSEPSEEEGESGKTENIRLYKGTLILKDNAIVKGGATSGSAIDGQNLGNNNKIILQDNAKVISDASSFSRLITNSQVLIVEGWAGEAYASLDVSDYGEQIPAEYAQRGTYTDGTFTAADAAFTGKLYVGKNNILAEADPAVTGGLKLVEAPVEAEPEFGKFEPEKYSGMAYCEACYKQAIAAGTPEAEAKADALKEWTAYDYKYCENTSGDYKTDDSHEHLYLTEDLPAFDHSRLVNTRGGIICFNLNGKSVTKSATATRAPLFHINGATAVLNIVDEKMEGQGASVLVGIAPTTITRGGAVWVQAGVANLYGGTYQDAAPVVDGELGNMIYRTVSATGGTLNMYEGAKIDGSAIDSTRQTVLIDGGTFNMYGGEIVGRAKMSGSNGGSVCVSGGSTFNMYGGTIHSGVAGDFDNADETERDGGNVYVTEGSTFNMAGGHIYGGAATGGSDNVYIASASKMIMSGNAKVTGGTVRYSAVQVNGTNANASTLVLKDNAAIIGTTNGEDVYLGVGVLGVAHSRTGTSSTIVVDPSWTGTTSAYLYRYYETTDAEGNPDWKTTGLKNGDTVECGVVTCGTYNEETGVITPATEINGELYAMNETHPIWVNAEGVLYIPGYSVETASGSTWYTTFAEALENYQITDAAYVGVWTDDAVVLTEDAYVALMLGCEPTVSGAYKLYAMDTNQDDYAGTVYDWTVAEETDVIRDVKNPVTGYRYLNITANKGEGTETINSTRLDLALSTVTLRAGKTSEGMGLYYKARMSMSEALAEKVTTYGVVLSLVEMPYADFASEGNKNGFTALETEKNPIGVNADNSYTVTLNSGSVFGIMKTEYETLPEGYTTAADYNAARGEMPVYANAYLEIDLNGDGTKEYVMADTDEGTANDVAWSLYEVLDTIDNRWSDFAAAQEKVTEFYKFWYQYGMNKWTFDNIKNA